MTKQELVSRLTALKVTLLNDTIGDADYTILENWYLAIDLDKDVFAKIVAAVGLETLIARHGHARATVQAQDEYRQRERYKADKLRLEELERETTRLRDNINAFEKGQVY